MSDKKNDIDTDFEENLAEMVNKKSRNRAKDKIYERLINDVQSNDVQSNDDSNEAEYVKPLESAEKLFAYEPLSVNELELFTNQDSDQAGQIEAVETTTTTNAVFDFSDQETAMSEASLKKEPQATDKLLEVDHLANDISNSDSTSDDDDLVAEDTAIQPLAKEKAVSRDKLANSKKPLIIGMIFGSLLIALIVMILIFTGVLSTSTQSTTPDNADTNVNSGVSTTVTPDSTPVATPAQATAIDADIVEKPIVVAPQQDSQDSQDSVANESQGKGATTTNEAAAPKALPTEPALTYEDFREESQSTLYRETDN